MVFELHGWRDVRLWPVTRTREASADQPRASVCPGIFTALVIQFLFRPRVTIRVPAGSRDTRRLRPGRFP